MTLWMQAAAAITDASSSGPGAYIQWGVSILLTSAAGAIGVLWRRDIAGLERVIALERAARVATQVEINNLSEANSYLTRKIETVTAECMATREELAREQTRRQTREEMARESRDPPPPRTITHPNLQIPAIPLPLPPPRGRGPHDSQT